MFVKPFSVKSSSSLKNSSARDLRSNVSYTLSSHDDFKNLVMDKLETHSGLFITLVKNIVGVPLYFKTNEWIPTLYAHCDLPVLEIPPVTSIFNGADVMIPGVSMESLLKLGSSGASVKKGAVCAVRFIGHHGIACIGTFTMDLDELILARKQGLRGKALLNLHFYGDELWKLGDKSTLNPMAEEEWDLVKNDGDDVVSIAETLSILDLDPGLDPDQMDSLLDEALLTCIKKMGGKVNPFPLSSSIFYSTHVIPNRPFDKLLNIKASTYKKVTKFFKAFEKQGLLKLKERGSDVMVMSAQFDHILVTEFSLSYQPWCEYESSTSVPTKKDDSKVSLESIWKAPSNSSITTWLATYSTPQPFYSQSSVKKAVESYISRENLAVPSNKRYVIIKDTILEPLITSRKEKEEGGIAQLPRDEIVARILDHSGLTEYHSLIIPSSRKSRFELPIDLHAQESADTTLIKSGKCSPIIIQVKQRGGNKKVTLIHNLHVFYISPFAFAEVVKKVCSSSTSVTHEALGMRVLVQGSQSASILQILESEYGIPVPVLPEKEKSKGSNSKKAKVYANAFVSVSE